MWYNSCYMYFSSMYFLSSVANSPQQPLINIYNVTVEPARFDRFVAQLMSKMKSWAVNNSTKFFAMGKVTNFSTEFSTIYGLVQCTPDMTKSQCQGCLEDLIDDFFKYASGTIGARTIGIHCNIRYETYPFYEGPAMVQIDSTIPSQSPAQAQHPASVSEPVINRGTVKQSNVRALAITTPVLVAALLLVIITFCLYKKRSHGRKQFLSGN